ncbi:MAG: Nif3-like dinuclear metal center hexameric protein [Clostridia bacterium]|nr:Nif3-like dinuclear metal center hexameric protein [Clostridia bacterium]
MKLYDFLDMMERIVPKAYAMEGDNVGLLVGTDREEIKKVLVALDCTVDVAREAVQTGADLVLCHHPLFFRPVSFFRPDNADTAAPYILARNGIAMFAAHTNLDAVHGGVNDVLAERVGLKEVSPLEPDKLGRIGYAEAGCTLKQLIERCERELGCNCRYCGDLDAAVNRVAVIGGSGGSDVFAAWKAGADTFITGEAKYGQGIEANTLGLKLIVCGHYETEAIVMESLISRLQMEKNEVQYYPSRNIKVALKCYGGGEDE